MKRPRKGRGVVAGLLMGKPLELLCIDYQTQHHVGYQQASVRVAAILRRALKKALADRTLLLTTLEHGRALREEGEGKIVD